MRYYVVLAMQQSLAGERVGNATMLEVSDWMRAQCRRAYLSIHPAGLQRAVHALPGRAVHARAM